MTSPLAGLVAAGLARPVPPAVAALAARIAGRGDTRGVLFYGSVLRTGALDGLIDLYVLTQPARAGPGRHLWPDISFVEETIDGVLVRAKVATMPLATFARAARGETLDTTIWTRFVQPAALVWTADERAGAAAAAAVTAAAVTAARFAAMLGPTRGTSTDYWYALFAETYRAELRVEGADRSRLVHDHDPAHFRALLPAAWTAGDVGWSATGEVLCPALTSAQRRRLAARWRRLRLFGKPLNLARLVKAALTLDGAARYGAWKVERHTGIAVAMTPFRERHPILAAPAVLWQVRRARRRARQSPNG